MREFYLEQHTLPRQCIHLASRLSSLTRDQPPDDGPQKGDDENGVEQWKYHVLQRDLHKPLQHAADGKNKNHHKGD